MMNTKTAHGAAVLAKVCGMEQPASTVMELALSLLRRMMKYENIFCNYGYRISMSSMDGFR
jgi:hypothetical protein